MTLTLWRGSQLLGELRARARSAYEQPPSRPRPPSLSAFLVPTPQAAALDGIWQIAWPPEAGIGVQQHAIEVDVVAEREQRAATRVTNPGPAALEPMSPEAVAGVPRDLQLTVRTADGATYLPRQIRLEEVRYGPALYEAALREVPREALVDGSVWCVFIAFASDAEAPAT
jgi:hypothetical protein